jgi:hypothetical protein
LASRRAVAQAMKNEEELQILDCVAGQHQRAVDARNIH